MITKADTSTKTVAEWARDLNVERAAQGTDTSEYADIRGRALVDPSLIPRRNQLRDNIKERDERIADIEAALAFAKRMEDEAAAAARVERRKEVHTVAMGHISELVEIVGEMDDTLDHLRTLIKRSDTVQAAWRSLVAQHLPPETKSTQIFETLGLVNIPDHRDIADAIKSIDHRRSGVTVGDFRPRVESARLRAKEASARIAQALGIDVP
jgi:hypothetical protein